MAYRTDDEARKVFQFNPHALSAQIHAQMHEPGHYWEKAEGGYEVKVSQGFTLFRPSAYTADAADIVHNYRVEPADKTTYGFISTATSFSEGSGSSLRGASRTERRLVPPRKRPHRSGSSRETCRRRRAGRPT